MSDPQKHPAAEFIWQGDFATWDDACRAGSTTDESFANDRWLSRMTQQLTDYRIERDTTGTAVPPRPTNLPWLCGLSRCRTILDFGGAAGWTWEVVRASVPSASVDDYIILETPPVVAHMRRLGLHGPPVRYESEGTRVGTVDVVYCNSVLQYFGSNADLLALLRRAQPRYVLLDDVLATDDTDAFTHQVYYEHLVPHRFLGLQVLLSDLATAGFRCLVRTPHLSPIRGRTGPLPVANLACASRIRYAMSLLFERTPDVRRNDGQHG